MTLATRHLIRPEHMNHHGCLYAGILSEWMTEASFVGLAAVLGRTGGVVLAAMKELSIFRSMYSGTILELNYRVTALGTTSITLEITGRDFLTGEDDCRAVFVYVTVDEQGKKIPHGLKLS